MTQFQLNTTWVGSHAEWFHDITGTTGTTLLYPSHPLTLAPSHPSCYSSTNSFHFIIHFFHRILLPHAGHLNPSQPIRTNPNQSQPSTTHPHPYPIPFFPGSKPCHTPVNAMCVWVPPLVTLVLPSLPSKQQLKDCLILCYTGLYGTVLYCL